MKRKTGNGSLLAIYRAMNLWVAGNQEIMRYIEDNAMPMVVNLYEHLCLDPLAQINSIFKRLGIFQGFMRLILLINALISPWAIKIF